MKEFLLPSTDGGVLIQIVATILVAPIVLVLVAKRQPDLAWLAGGVVALWIGLMGFRAPSLRRMESGRARPRPLIWR